MGESVTPAGPDLRPSALFGTSLHQPRSPASRSLHIYEHAHPLPTRFHNTNVMVYLDTIPSYLYIPDPDPSLPQLTLTATKVCSLSRSPCIVPELTLTATKYVPVLCLSEISEAAHRSGLQQYSYTKVHKIVFYEYPDYQ